MPGTDSRYTLPGTELAYGATRRVSTGRAGRWLTWQSACLPSSPASTTLLTTKSRSAVLANRVVLWSGRVLSGLACPCRVLSRRVVLSRLVAGVRVTGSVWCAAARGTGDGSPCRQPQPEPLAPAPRGIGAGAAGQGHDARGRGGAGAGCKGAPPPTPRPTHVCAGRCAVCAILCEVRTSADMKCVAARRWGTWRKATRCTLRWCRSKRVAATLLFEALGSAMSGAEL
eukprot:512953-Rhodomonas_salina.1